MNFDMAFDRLIGHEGGYSNHPRDPGRETMWGVTAAVARAFGYSGAMRDLPRDTAKLIYRRQYWDSVRADDLPDTLRFHVFDAAVNSGVKQATLWLQRAAGATADGIIGPRTLAAVRAADPARLAGVYCGLRLQFMTDLPTWDAFGKGWARRMAANLMEV
ncbi:glycoside hydrolase family 108 protein [Azoarcus sp. L1K30]|uniref:glycoside hydrolase family 108 protein n=1 Tax=Azoarcus sp. L1K30 TaxID=2820277 RepID=UPI001B81AB68|nr:glycoside hydrolase family 108 protein [Azoarcus sp. L1K30]MBR0568352.1 glycoside hydrolase family 108 protein [Azoarcus sp. L1K30]